MDRRFITVILLLASALSSGSCEEGYDEPFYYFDTFHLIPILGECYQLYHNEDINCGCRREPDLKNQACVQWLSQKEKCLGLITPANETIVLSCTSKIRYDKCFEVYDENEDVTIICQQLFNGYSVGITTPQNFTVLFQNNFCRTTNNIMERQIYADFFTNYSLEADSKSCYKIYSSDQEATPYNCMSEDIYESCIFTVSDDCTGLMTQNNEVLILDCTNKTKVPKDQHCFYLYSSDNQIHTVCKEKIEERCVGLVTPSNVTVLLDCFYCTDSMRIVFHNDVKRRQQRQFVKNSLTNAYAGFQAHFTYAVSYKDEFGNPYCDSAKIHYIEKTSCFGLLLNTNETLILECFFPNENQEQTGCFQLIGLDNEKSLVCAKILNEDCIGITTTRNVSVNLACYSRYKDCLDYYNPDSLMKTGNTFVFMGELDNFKRGRYNLKVGETVAVFKDDTVVPQRDSYEVVELQDPPQCTGIVTEIETILIECLNMNNIGGCYKIIKQGNVRHNNGSDYKKQKDEYHVECLKVLNSYCIGITLSNNRIMSFKCFSPEVNIYEMHHQAGSAISAGEQAYSFLSNIRDNKPPPRE